MVRIVAGGNLVRSTFLKIGKMKRAGSCQAEKEMMSLAPRAAIVYCQGAA